MTRTKHNGWTIIRRDNALGTNLADKTQPTILVIGPRGQRSLMGRWTLLCLKCGAIPATEATDAQIIDALTHDESVFA